MATFIGLIMNSKCQQTLNFARIIFDISLRAKNKANALNQNLIAVYNS